MELRRKFKSGPWIYGDKQVDMYLLSHWLIYRKNKTGILVRPSEVTEPIIKEFIDAYPNGLKEIN